MSLRLLHIAVLTILVSLSTAAFGQYQVADKSRLGVAAALFMPSDGTLSDIKGTWMGAGVDFHVHYDAMARPDVMMSLGWFGNESGSTKASLVPIRATYIKRFSQSESGGWYVGGGPAICFAKYEGTDYNPVSRNFEFGSDSSVVVGLGVVAGLEFGGAWFAQISYDKFGKLERFNGSKIDASGLALTFGTRLAM